MTHLETAQTPAGSPAPKHSIDTSNNDDEFNNLQWFTTRISSPDDHLIHIRDGRSRSPDRILYLDRAQSKLLTAILNELADDETIPFGAAKLAALKAFWKALRASP